jgi:RNA polymerase sigma-70 factor (ECF subfamily)
LRVELAENQTVQSLVNNDSGDSQPAARREDVRLLASIAERDQPALAALYRKHGDLLYSLLVRMLSDEMEAQEVMQDTFLLIWRRAHQYDPERSAPLSWIIMLARGLALDRLRARARRENRQAAYQRELASLELETGPRRNDHDELAAACASALNRLPEPQSRPLQLAFLRGWTHEEIARATGEPLGTIKARIRRGLLALRQALKDYHA